MDNVPVVVDSAKESTFRYVTFNIGEELFGVDIMHVESIISPQTITTVPRTPDYFLGIINLRGEVISIIDMRLRFGMEKREITPDTRIVVTLTNGILIGMMVDRINAIEVLVAGDIRKAPQIAALEKQKFISGSFKLRDGRILLILLHEKLIDERDFIVERDLQFTHDIIESESKPKKEWVREIPLVSFSIGSEHYTLESTYVDEIIFLPEITAVPDMDDIIEGIFYLRESVVPIIRLGEKIGLGKVNVTSDSQVIILKKSIFGIKVGLTVEDISEIFFIREDELTSAPINLNKAQSEHLKGVFKLAEKERNKIVMLLNLEKIFSLDEQERLQELDFSGKQEEEKETEKEAPAGILEFFLADERYAVRVAETNEIIRVVKTVPVPKAPPYIKGIINLRGDVISIVDLSLLVDKQRKEPGKDARILIVSTGSETAGLLVEKVIGIRKVALSSFDPPSDLIRQKGNIFIEGIGKIEQTGEIVVLMDIETTLQQAQSMEEDEEELHMVRQELEYLEEEDDRLEVSLLAEK